MDCPHCHSGSARKQSPRGGRHRRPRRAVNSDLAIETSLILRTVFHQPLRQTEGLVSSLLGLMGLDLPVPDHSTWRNRSGADVSVMRWTASASGTAVPHDG